MREPLGRSRSAMTGSAPQRCAPMRLVALGRYGRSPAPSTAPGGPRCGFVGHQAAEAMPARCAKAIQAWLPTARGEAMSRPSHGSFLAVRSIRVGRARNFASD
jgi:hypothetical protein